MISYNAKLLQAQLTSLSVLTRTNICIMDDVNYVTDAKNTNLDVYFCRYMGECFHDKCVESDFKALENAKKQGGSIYYSCHFGFTEIMMCYKMTDKSKIYVSVGPFRIASQKKKETSAIEELCKAFNKDFKKATKMYKQIPTFTIEKFEAIKNMVDTIVEKAKSNKDIFENENFVENDFKPFILNNLKDNFALEYIANHFCLTEKQLEKKVKSQTGLTPRKYINKLKMDYALSKIKESNESLIDIASSTGFIDYNYFVKVFKSVEGKTPSMFRKN